MPHILALYLFGFWLAFALAHLEIAVEGKNGWAEKLPTWRYTPKNFLLRFILSTRPVTGYHLWYQISVYSLLHAVYLFVPVSAAIELQLLSLYFFIMVCEDFLWFLLNPAFGIRKFKKENIWWHKNSWLFIAPRDYYLGIAIVVLLYFFSTQVS